MKALMLAVAVSLTAQFCLADLIVCDNGDRYNGKVLSMDEKAVTLQNEITGKLVIPRTRIVSIAFREVAAPAPVVNPRTNAFSPTGRLQVDAEAVQKVQNELLATATPEANQMFDEMVQGLTSGQMNMGDLRNKAQTTLNELRALQGELGDPETAELLNTYGAILENFLRQASTNTAPTRNAPTKP